MNKQDFYFGNKQIKDLYYGDKPIQSLYLGKQMIWERNSTTTVMYCNYEMNDRTDSTGNNGDLPSFGSFSDGIWSNPSRSQGQSNFGISNLFNQTDTDEKIIECRFKIISGGTNGWVNVYELYRDSSHRMFNLINCTTHHLEIGGYDANGTVFDKSAACDDLVYNEWITMKIVYRNTPERTYSVYINDALMFTNTVKNPYPPIGQINWNDVLGSYDGNWQIDYFKIYGK